MSPTTLYQARDSKGREWAPGDGEYLHNFLFKKAGHHLMSIATLESSALKKQIRGARISPILVGSSCQAHSRKRMLSSSAPVSTDMPTAPPWGPDSSTPSLLGMFFHLLTGMLRAGTRGGRQCQGTRQPRLADSVDTIGPDELVLSSSVPLEDRSCWVTKSRSSTEEVLSQRDCQRHGSISCVWSPCSLFSPCTLKIAFHLSTMSSCWAAGSCVPVRS